MPSTKKARASMQDVADAARVSRATVSRALRTDPRIPEPTRARVRAAAEKLGYRTNARITSACSSPPGGNVASAAIGASAWSSLAGSMNAPTAAGSARTGPP